MAKRIAIKRLALVEVDPTVSHQHEFNAGSLRQELGFGLERTSGPLRLVIYASDEPGDIEVGEGRFTLYDARERHPARSEWRLYYDLAALGQAEAGDLLVLFREAEDSLAGIVARAGTRVESELTSMLARGDINSARRFTFSDSPRLSEQEARPLAEALAPSGAGEADYVDAVEELVSVAIASDQIPATKEMARIAELAIERIHGPLSPDLALFHGLEAETDIYFALEDSVVTPRLAALRDSGADFAELSSFVLRIHQSRKSRRGQSLQNHFGRLLDRESIPYTAQCRTEKGETPDFVIPGCSQYHDPAYPASRLRMVACKSTARERWRQILSEAARIRQKSLLTVDTGLSASVIAAMNAAAIRVYIPAPITSKVYAGEAQRIGTVSELIVDLRSTIADA